MNTITLFLLVASLAGALGRQRNQEIAVASNKIQSLIHQSGFQSILPKNLVGSVLPLTSEYSSTGWVTRSVYEGSSCTEFYGSEGLRVNTCHKRNGEGAKFQLVENSCDGAVIEYFTDLNCENYDRTELLLAPSTCFPYEDDDSGLSEMITCTTSSVQIVEDNTILMNYYRDISCGTVISYNTFATDVCLGSVKFSCSKDEVLVTSYTAESCGGSAQKHSMSSTCSAGGGDDGDDGADDDDYYYYSPGEGADTFSATCSSGNGSGSSSDSLSSGAVVGIAIGGFAFLALFAAGVYYLFFMKATRATSVVTPAPAVQMSNGVHAA